MVNRKWTYCVILLLLMLSVNAKAQVGAYRNDFAIGINGGIALNSIRFLPKANLNQHVGPQFGLTFRYTCEKYFKSICALQAELNYSSIGFKEKIQDVNRNPVINLGTGEAERYSRTMNYLQMPLLARLGWGGEDKGFQFYIVAGPQIGLFLNESTNTNYEYSQRHNVDPDNRRSSLVDTMEVMPVENKFDYGITAGVGFEFSRPKLGHFALDARYYYGLGDIYGNTKRDYFGSSNHGTIVIKLAYLFDIRKTKNKLNFK